MLDFLHDVVGELLEEDGIVAFVVDELKAFFACQRVQFLPADVRTILQAFHHVGDPNRLLPDHHAEFASVLQLFAVHSEGLVLEDCLMVFPAEERVRAHVIVRLLVHWLEDSGVREGRYILRHHVGQLFVMLDLILFEQTQPIQATQIGVDQLFTDGWALYFGYVLF
jgi:hypothetical protein